MVLLVLTGCVGLQAVPSGADSGPVALGGLTISHSAIDFGEVAVGGLSEESVTLNNAGTAPAKVAVAVTGEGFSADSALITVLKGGDAVLTVAFEPDEDLDYTGELVFTVDTEELVVPLRGIGGSGGGGDDSGTDTDEGGGELTTDQPSLSFGTLDLGDSSMRSLTVSNTGDAPLTIDAATASDAAFALGGNLTPPRTLDPGESRVVEVTFTPSSAKAYSAELTLSSDDPGSPKVKIPLSGTGFDGCDICAPLITVNTGGSSDYALQDFVSLWGSTDSRAITIGNDGDQDLEVRSIVVNNDFIATCGAFWVSGWSGSATVKPGKTTSFTLNYKATESCLDVAQKSLDANVVHINSNDGAEADYVIELGGTGVFL